MYICIERMFTPWQTDMCDNFFVEQLTRFKNDIILMFYVKMTWYGAGVTFRKENFSNHESTFLANPMFKH